MMPDDSAQLAAAVPPTPISGGGGGPDEIPPSLETAIFKRFWIWLCSLSAIILALGGLVWALSVSELKEYAKNVSENKAVEEWRKIRVDIADEMRRVRDELSKTTESASRAVGDSRERVGEANEVSKSARKIADNVEGELKRLQTSIKTAGDIFAAKTELETAINNVVSKPEFQAQFGSRIDALQTQFGARIDGLQNRVDTVEGVAKVHQSALKDIGGGRILGIGQVRSGSLVTQSDGVTFDRAGNRIFFPNPKNLRVVAMLTDNEGPGVDGGANGYITETHFVKVVGPNYVEILTNALDTSGRTWPAAHQNFSIVILGFDIGLGP